MPVTPPKYMTSEAIALIAPLADIQSWPEIYDKMRERGLAVPETPAALMGLWKMRKLRLISGANPRPARDPKPEKVPARKCLQCQNHFVPKTRFLFRCDNCKRYAT